MKQNLNRERLQELINKQNKSNQMAMNLLNNGKLEEAVFHFGLVSAFSNQIAEMLKENKV